MKRIGLLISILLLFGCYKNPYNRFYVPNPGAQGIKILSLKEGQQPLIKYTDEVNQSDAELLAKGYVQVGHASPGYGASGYEAEAQAYWIFASVVIIHRSSTTAFYYCKRVTLPRVGIYFRDLSNQDKKDFQTNNGAVVRAVVEDTPPFMANILPGDVFIEIAGEGVRNSDGAYALLERTNTDKGSKVPTKLIRNRVEKVIVIDF